MPALVHPFANGEATISYIHCDVFAKGPFSGNSLAVFPDSGGLTDVQKQTLTQELRHFESIFLVQEGDKITAQIFDLASELPFAGHPLIGAACMLHRASASQLQKDWRVHLQDERAVDVTTVLQNGHYTGTLDQGIPRYLATLPDDLKPAFARAFDLKPADIADLPLEVISTGLRYLVVPVRSGLATARITIPDLHLMLAALGAEFAYVVDVTRMEGRHWNNDGIIEDVATGSAAGVIGAYALKHGLAADARSFTLKQGHFIGRPSEIRVTAYGSPARRDRVTVAGAVAFVGTGQLVLP
jgi:trans-2,3-dihydro-3-hydroxyanthranilate isomerase